MQTNPFTIGRVSETPAGRPMLEIEPVPLDHRGNLDLSYELIDLIRPHLGNADNITIRFVSNGLPTTALAVLSAMTIEEDGVAVVYEIRSMIFETPSQKVGCNVHVRPIKLVVGEEGMILFEHKIADAQIYDFVEVYDSVESSQNDLVRLVRIGHEHYASMGLGTE